MKTWTTNEVISLVISALAVGISLATLLMNMP
jgi:hypothetical protein